MKIIGRKNIFNNKKSITQKIKCTEWIGVCIAKLGDFEVWEYADLEWIAESNGIKYDINKSRPNPNYEPGNVNEYLRRKNKNIEQMSDL